MSAIDENPTAKQLARRALIVDAAVETLRRSGIAGCTVRAIAAATPFTKGTIHYYFTDVNEIVNTAYLRLTDDYVAAVDAVAGESRRPMASFWRAVESYLEGFSRHRGMGLLWFEYSSWAVRNGYGHGVASSVEAIRTMFARRMERLDPPADEAAGRLTRYLLGTVLEVGVSTTDLRAVMADVAKICQLRAPRVGDGSVAHGDICPLCRSGEPDAIHHP